MDSTRLETVTVRGSSTADQAKIMEVFHVPTLKRHNDLTPLVGARSLTEGVYVRHVQTKFPEARMSDTQFDFASFVSANAENEVSGFDYLHAIYRTENLPADFILWFAKLFWPEFTTTDGMVFVSEVFDARRYQDLLNEGHGYKNSQFWMNLLEVTGLFDQLSTVQAMIVAESLANSWNSKLQKEGVFSVGLARAICDEKTGEVYVTIDDPE